MINYSIKIKKHTKTFFHKIKKLSEAIGLPLFEHVGRNVQSTEAGSVLYEACRNIFESLANLEMNMADLKGLKRGRLSLSVISTAQYIAPEILGEFSRQYPGIDLALEVTNRNKTIEKEKLMQKINKSLNMS